MLLRTSLRSVQTLLRSAGTGALFAVALAVPGPVMAAGTAPNTTITNTATATYTDANNVSYTTNSNTVTTTVQNAPSLTIDATAAQNVSPGELVVDNFTITNTGNAAGAIALSTPASGGTIATNAYVLNGAATGTCSAAAPCSLATLNAQAALTAAAVGTAVTIGVEYSVPATTPAGTTISTTLTGTITQPAVSASVPATTSAPASTATDADTVLADARLDLFKSATPPTTSTGLITYTIAGNDGGGFGAKAVNSAGAFLGLGAATPGVIAVLDKVPTFPGAATQAQLIAPVLPTLPPGDTGVFYYSLDGTAWSPTFNAAAAYLALFVTTTNPGGIVFPANPSGSTGGGVAQTSPQFSLTFQTTQPVGNGVANPGVLTNIANSVIGGNPGVNGTPIIAPGVPVDADYESASTPSFPASTFAPVEANTTPSSGKTAPGGASNLVTTQAFASQTSLVGPLDNAAATGSYNGVVAVSTQDDFTAVGFVCANGATVAANTCTFPAAGVSIPNTVSNGGNATDTYNLYASAPSGYTVQLFAVTGCPTTTPTVLPIAPYGAGCTVGAAISPLSASGGSVTTTTGFPIAAGATFNYVALYAAASGTTPAPFTALNFPVIAYGTGAVVTAGVPTLGPDANQTTNVLYPGGPIQIVKSQTIVSNCAGTPTAVAGTVCPGGTITYSLAYKNVAPAALATGGTAAGSEPAFAFNGIVANASTISDDGTTGTNSWAASTFGIDAVVAPVIPAGGTVTYSGAATSLSTGTYPAKTQGATKISVALGTIQPGAAGTISYQVTVK